MTRTYRLWVVVGMVGLMAGAVLADGMIVPVRPEIRVRGAWAVKYHHVNVTVRDQVASVGIDQEFVNTGRGMIEVEYLFPVPPGAAIDSMTLVVDGKEFAAKLLKADEARRIYESIVRRKKDPALLEYVGFGLYKTRAFPLQPGKPCKVIVTYKNVCKRDRDVVEVWYPLNTEKFSARAIESVRVRADIKSKADIGPVYSPTHSLNVDRKDPRHVIATYEAKNVLPTSDFQVFYKAANEKIGATLLSHQGDAKKDGHFMLLVSPNPRSSRQAVVAKDIVIAFDHSGSMSGQKIQQAKEAFGHILKNLGREDRFNVVAYNDAVTTCFESMTGAAEKRVADALDMIDRVEATGGTNIHEAVLAAVKMIASKKANTAGVRIFAFGVGYQPNVRLLDRLVGDNNGRSDYVKPKEPIEAKVSSLYNKIKNPVMTGLKLEVQGLRVRDLYPRELGDLFDGDQIVVVGRYDCRDVAKLPTREKGIHQTTLVVKGYYQGKQRAFEYNVDVRSGGRDIRFLFVEKIWAIRRVGYLMDQIQLHGKSQEVIDELIRLSKTYGIMTPYTSFLAEETTPLHRPAEVRHRAGRLARGLADDVAGEKAHRAADMRKRLKAAAKAPRTSAPGPVPGEPAREGKGGGVALWGSSSKDKYEAEKVEYVAGVRTVGAMTLYQRGRVWVAATAASLDLKKDAEKIQVIHRFSKEYFDLIRQNTVHENQVMASQRDTEELLIKLRGKAYLVK